jgi:hypothetical protein
MTRDNTSTGQYSLHERRLDVVPKAWERWLRDDGLQKSTKILNPVKRLLNKAGYAFIILAFRTYSATTDKWHNFNPKYQLYIFIY